MSLYQIRARQGPQIKTYLIFWQLFGPKISLEIHCWPITTFFKTVGENFLWCQIVLGVKLSSVSNCPITHIQIFLRSEWDFHIHKHVEHFSRVTISHGIFTIYRKLNANLGHKKLRKHRTKCNNCCTPVIEIVIETYVWFNFGSIIELVRYWSIFALYWLCFLIIGLQSFKVTLHLFCNIS